MNRTAQKARNHLKGITDRQVELLAEIPLETLSAIWTELARITAHDHTDIREHATVIIGEVWSAIPRKSRDADGSGRIGQAAATARRKAMRTVDLAATLSHESMDEIADGIAEITGTARNIGQTAIDHPDTSPSDNGDRITASDLIASVIGISGDSDALVTAIRLWRKHAKGCDRCESATAGMRPLIAGIRAHMEHMTKADANYHGYRRAVQKAIAALPQFDANGYPFYLGYGGPAIAECAHKRNEAHGLKSCSPAFPYWNGLAAAIGMSDPLAVRPIGRNSVSGVVTMPTSLEYPYSSIRQPRTISGMARISGTTTHAARRPTMSAIHKAENAEDALMAIMPKRVPDAAWPFWEIVTSADGTTHNSRLDEYGYSFGLNYGPEWDTYYRDSAGDIAYAAMRNAQVGHGRPLPNSADGYAQFNRAAITTECATYAAHSAPIGRTVLPMPTLDLLTDESGRKRFLTDAEAATVATPRQAPDGPQTRPGEETGNTAGHNYGRTLMGHARPNGSGAVLGGLVGPVRDAGITRTRPKGNGGSGQTGATASAWSDPGAPLLTRDESGDTYVSADAARASYARHEAARHAAWIAEDPTNRTGL